MWDICWLQHKLFLSILYLAVSVENFSCVEFRTYFNFNCKKGKQPTEWESINVCNQTRGTPFMRECFGANLSGLLKVTTWYFNTFEYDLLLTVHVLYIALLWIFVISHLLLVMFLVIYACCKYRYSISFLLIPTWGFENSCIHNCFINVW